MKIDFYQKVREAEAEIKSYYIHLHRHPELSGQEYKTQEWILGQLKKWKVECRPCADTGVYAVIKSGRPGHTIALRADMDALPVTEQTGLAWQSENPGSCMPAGTMSIWLYFLGVSGFCRSAGSVCTAMWSFYSSPPRNSREVPGV